MVLALCEMETASSKIWTLIADSIFYAMNACQTFVVYRYEIMYR